MKAHSEGRYVTFLTAHTVVNPATVLESTEMNTGKKYIIAEIPESRQEYAEGQVLKFGSVNAARAFVKALNAMGNGQVCRMGR